MFYNVNTKPPSQEFQMILPVTIKWYIMELGLYITKDNTEENGIWLTRERLSLVTTRYAV